MFTSLESHSTVESCACATCPQSFAHLCEDIVIDIKDINDQTRTRRRESEERTLNFRDRRATQDIFILSSQSVENKRYIHVFSFLDHLRDEIRTTSTVSQIASGPYCITEDMHIQFTEYTYAFSDSYGRPSVYYEYTVNSTNVVSSYQRALFCHGL